MIQIHKAGPVSKDRRTQACSRCGIVINDESSAGYVDGYGLIGIAEGATVEWYGLNQWSVVDNAEPTCTTTEGE